MENVPLQVSEALSLINQSLEYAFPVLVIEGEVSSFKVNQGKYVFFDIKDDEATLGCFMMVFSLRVPLEDGMRVRIIATPKLTQWGKFSLTVREVVPVGAGSIKRSFELLKAKLEKEGLFDEARKRPLPAMPSRIGLITSTQAAGYVDFTTILNQRWGGMEVMVANVTVQGVGAPQQIINAIEYFNQMSEPPEVLVIVRGGGSADDLAAFNDEPLVRAIAGSRVPTMVGVGHEVDTSLSDLAADVRAATPSNAAQLLVPDRTEILAWQRYLLQQCIGRMERVIDERLAMTLQVRQDALAVIDRQWSRADHEAAQLFKVVRQLDPNRVLKRGYAVLRRDGAVIAPDAGSLAAGDTVTIELDKAIIDAGVNDVRSKS